MAAINAKREIEKVEATLDKLQKQERLYTALTRRHEGNASSATFAGYTDAEVSEYEKNKALLERTANALVEQRQLLAALNASKDAKPTFRTAMVGELGADGNYYIDDEDCFDDMLYGEDGGEEEIEDDEWVGAMSKDLNDEVSAFASVTARLKEMGFDPANYAPTTAPKAAADPNAGPLLPHEAKSSTSGDNDILRYAKMGDLEAFRNEENIEGVDPVTFRDNNGRTCLHYAADGGSEALVNYLLGRGLSAVARDEKGITPLAIAVILQRKGCVELLAEHARTVEKSFVASSLLDPVAQGASLIPMPPRFVMSKGAPPLGPNRPHAFWGVHQNTNVDGITPIDFSSEAFNAEGVLKFLNSADSAAAGSYYAWLSPLHPLLISRSPSGTFAICTPNCDVFSMASLMKGATLLAGPTRRAVSTAVALVGATAIAPCYRKGGDAVTAFSLMRTALRNKHAQVGVFTSAADGPAHVCGPVARVKWYRRTLNTLQLIDNTSPTIVRELYPDFAKYEATLRIDSHLKGLFHGSNKVSLQWVNVKEAGPEAALAYAKAILKFMDTELARTSECHFLFDSVDDLINNLLSVNEVYAVGTPERVTDVVVLGARVSREKAADGATPLATAAIHVFSLFTSLAGEERLLEMAKLAGSLMGADVFYASNTHGISEDNMRAAMFDEQAAYGTNLFVMGENFTSAISKVAPAKVYLPFAQM